MRHRMLRHRWAAAAETGAARAQTLSMPRCVTVESGIGGQPPQKQVLIMLPREPDASEYLEAVLGERDATLTNERLRDTRQLGRVCPRGLDTSSGRDCHCPAALQQAARIGKDVLDRLERS